MITGNVFQLRKAKEPRVSLVVDGIDHCDLSDFTFAYHSDKDGRHTPRTFLTQNNYTCLCM